MRPAAPPKASLRPVADALSKTWKQPVIIESKGGGGTTIGAGYIAEQTARRLPAAVHGLIRPHHRAQHVQRTEVRRGEKLHADLRRRDVTLFDLGQCIVARSARSRDLIAHAKANPGKVNYGSSGAGTGPHLSGEILKQDVGIETVHVSFRGAAPAITALLGSHIDYLVTDISALPLVQAGQLRALAVTSLERSPYLPEVPTVHETVDQGIRGHQPCRADGARPEWTPS